MQRLSEYRVMWVMIFFDLPTNTVKEKRAYTIFRKDLMKDGFTMFQFSIYVRHCASRENADVHVKRVKSRSHLMPPVNSSNYSKNRTRNILKTLLVDIERS